MVQEVEVVSSENRKNNHPRANTGLGSRIFFLCISRGESLYVAIFPAQVHANLIHTLA